MHTGNSTVDLLQKRLQSSRQRRAISGARWRRLCGRRIDTLDAEQVAHWNVVIR